MLLLFWSGPFIPPPIPDEDLTGYTWGIAPNTVEGMAILIESSHTEGIIQVTRGESEFRMLVSRSPTP